MFAGSPSGSVTIATVRAVPITVHWSVALVAALFAFGLWPVYGMAASIVGVVAFLASITLHELAHAAAARRFGVSTSLIQLGALGGVAHLDREAPSPRAEAWIAASGPLMSFALAAVGVGSWFALTTAGLGGPFVGIVGWLGIINAVLAVFNLLPGAPLDGGRLVKAARWKRHGDRFRATREAADAGRVVGWAVAALGIALMINGRGGLFVAMTGLFIIMSAKAEIASSYIYQALDGQRVRDLLWFGIAGAPPDTDADTIVFQRRRLGGAGVVAVQHVGGPVLGLVDEDRLLAIPEHRRPWVSLASMMVPLREVPRVEMDDEIVAVLPRLTGRAPFLTVWNGDRLLGVVPKKRLLGNLSQA